MIATKLNLPSLAFDKLMTQFLFYSTHEIVLFLREMNDLRGFIMKKKKINVNLKNFFFIFSFSVRVKKNLLNKY